MLEIFKRKTKLKEVLHYIKKNKIENYNIFIKNNNGRLFSIKSSLVTKRYKLKMKISSIFVAYIFFDKNNKKDDILKKQFIKSKNLNFEIVTIDKITEAIFIDLGSNNINNTEKTIINILKEIFNENDLSKILIETVTHPSSSNYEKKIASLYEFHLIIDEIFNIYILKYILTNNTFIVNISFDGWVQIQLIHASMCNLTRGQNNEFGIVLAILLDDNLEVKNEFEKLEFFDNFLYSEGAYVYNCEKDIKQLQRYLLQILKNVYNFNIKQRSINIELYEQEKI